MSGITNLSPGNGKLLEPRTEKEAEAMLAGPSSLLTLGYKPNLPILNLFDRAGGGYGGSGFI